MKKRRYDLIVGLGSACSCTMVLRRAGLQHLSFPFDWIGPKPNADDLLHDVRLRAEHIASEFSDRWFRAEDFVRYEPTSEHPRDCYFNEGLKLMFLHDFEKGEDFAAAFPRVQAKYTKRINRLLTCIRSSRRVLLLRIDRPDLDVTTPIEECKAAVKVLSEHFAPVSFELLLLHRECGRSYANRLETDHGDGVSSLVFDYDADRDDRPAYQPDINLLAQVLASRYEVRDYRTPEERAEWKRRMRQKEYAKFGVHNWWQLRLAKWRRRSARLLGLLDTCRLPLALLARTRYAQIVPLGYNCETAFRFYCKWGFLDSSLFAWTSVSSIDRLVEALADLDRVGTGDMHFSNRSMMWTCANTDVCFHGRLKPVPNAQPPSPADLDADLADLRGRIAHLKEKLRRYAANDRSTLFVYKPRPSDIERDGFNAKIEALERAIDGLGAQNWKLLVVCERSFCGRVQPGKNRIIRTVRRYSPHDDVTNRKKGDPTGWNLIFTEFAPEKILPKKHAFKFE